MKMLIRGGQHLTGRFLVMGSKNAAGPLLAATLLLRGETRFRNIPHLTDILHLLEIMQDMGARVEWTGEHELLIDTRSMDGSRLDKKKMKRMRYSILLLGPMLGRFQRVVVPEPGGCTIGNRPIDTHLVALQGLGARIQMDISDCLIMEAKTLKGTEIILPEFSVTATENLIMAASVAKGRTSIRLAAAEPHVQELCRFLNACGAKIRGIGTHELEIIGVKSLRPPRRVWSVVPDMIEAGTLAVGAALTHGDVEIFPVIPGHLDAVRSLLERIGIHSEWRGRTWRIFRSLRFEAFTLKTLIYPGFATDLQAPFGLLATQCHGTSMIFERLFESRLGYVSELIKMGANAVIADPHRAMITGPTPLHGTEIRSLDLRAGVTMILAGLIAEGETIIHDAEMVYRGYEQLDERLRRLGAEITCVQDL